MQDTTARLIQELKGMRIPYKAASDNGKWTTWPDFAPGLWGEGESISASIDDMIRLWRECAAMSAQGDRDSADRMPYYMKVLISTDEELKGCLDGQICEDS